MYLTSFELRLAIHVYDVNNICTIKLYDIQIFYPLIIAYKYLTINQRCIANSVSL